ncbi:unannotated protein [freshwater metagenome]|uniref:Unannotated protein n=1 Tax=freshwater metagenome TaxID=449393 RepID=A0A6J7E9J2_9ZZZZ|nr:GAF domain-containing protein [Actinomycetota bacterium]
MALTAARRPNDDDGPSSIGYPEVVSAFSEVADAINEHTSLDTLLHLVAERICGLLEIRRCSIYLKDAVAGVFRGQVGHADRDIDVAIKRLTAGIEADEFTREILRTQEPVVIVNAQSDPRPVRSAMIGWNIRAMLGVPMILRGEIIGLIFLDNEDLNYDFTAERRDLSQTFANLAAVAISQAQLYVDLRTTMSTVAQQNSMLRRAAALEDRLTNLVLDGANLNQIAAAVTELTGKPCAIHDAEYRRLAHASPGDDAIVPGLFEPAALRNEGLREALAKLTPRRPTVIPAFPAVGLNQRCLVALVRVGDHDWGYLVISEYRRRFGAQDAIVARRTATTIALGLSGKRRAAEADAHGVEALVRDLLHGADERGSLSRRADYHGLAVSEPHHVVLFGPRGGAQASEAIQAQVSAAHVAAAFAEVASQLPVFIAAVDRGAAVIVRWSDEADGQASLGDLAAEVARRLAPDGTVAGAVSGVCRDPADYPGAYEQTAQIIRGISTFGASGHVHVLAAEELGAGRLLLASADRGEADRFVRDTLGPLLTDEEGMRDLFVTLQAFFECGRSVRRAGTALEVHENTIRYRLSRIEQITGLDVASDCDVQLSVQLALLILRLQDRLKAPADAEVVAPAN